MPVVDADDWSAEEGCAVANDTIAERAATPTFAGKRRATALFRDFLAAEADAGRRVIVAGSERDTRFFARRLRKR